MRPYVPETGFPLLSRELRERSARGRTYVLRTISAVSIYVTVLFAVSGEIFARVRSPFGAIGVGKELLESLFTVATLGIYLVVPAMTCGAVAGERERNTWNLLRVTRLGDTVILFEKYLGCLVSASTFLVLSIPIMVIAYPLGGMTAERILDAVWCLSSCILLVGAIGICCSAWTRTIVGALLSTYFLLIAWYLVPIFGLLFLFPGLGRYDESIVHRSIVYFFPLTAEEAYVPGLVFHAFQRVPADGFRIPALAYYSIPTVLQTGFLLLLARVGIARSTDSGGVSFWRSVLVRLDAWFKRINQNRFTQGREIFTYQGVLPVEHPLAWRESNRVLFNHPVYRIRLLVCVLGIFTGIMGVTASEGMENALAMVSAVFMLLGCVVLSINSAGVISRERSGQTLDVLLAIPISPREILHDKLAGVRYWQGGLIGILSLILLLRAYLAGFFFREFGPSILASSGSAFLRFLVDFSTLCFLPRLAIWVSVAVGLRVAGYMRGVLTAMAILGVWSGFGFLAAGYGSGMGQILFPVTLIGSLSSPLFVNSLFYTWPIYLFRGGWIACLIFGNAIFYWWVGGRLKRSCESRVGESLGRLEACGPSREHSAEVDEEHVHAAESGCQEAAT